MTTSASSNSSSWLETYNPAKGRPALVSAEQWKPLRSCVLEAIAPLSHLSPSSLSPFLRALINVSLYVRANHQELSVSWILSPQVLATYSKAKGVTHDDLGRLRRLAGLHHLSTNEAHPRGASRQHYHRPYSGDEVTALLRAADALSTDNRQINATVLILLGAGCGLTRQNATEVTADSLHLHGDALFVAAPKHCAKVRVCFEDELRALVTRRPEGRLRGTMTPEERQALREKHQQYFCDCPDHEPDQRWRCNCGYWYPCEVITVLDAWEAEREWVATYTNDPHIYRKMTNDPRR